MFAGIPSVDGGDLALQERISGETEQAWQRKQLLHEPGIG